MKENKKQIISIFRKLKKFDTPTICNALELIDPKLQGKGFTKLPHVTLNKSLSPIMGYARTATIVSSVKKSKITKDQFTKYFEYMDKGDLPKICIIEDINKKPVGCYWGEVMSNIHKSMGFEGVVTNGAIRDLDAMASNFQMLAGCVLPSHAFIKHISLGKKINVLGQTFSHDDIVHADCHGAVIINKKYLSEILFKINDVLSFEKPILELCNSKKFSTNKLINILYKTKKIH